MIRRIKLKAQLRNCDYVLAGTVIKQQYYDSNKNTEINLLIDQYLADPGFEEALKLIKYNDMMVFYFTESCQDGLYIRRMKTQEPWKASSEPQPDFSQEANSPTNNPEPPDLSRNADVDLEELLHQKQIQESEQWLEQMISKRIANQSSLFESEAVAAKRPNFTNVVATLKIDIHSMTKELEEYRRQLSYFPPNEMQLRAWIKSLEEAIQEFTRAVDLLEGND